MENIPRLLSDLADYISRHQLPSGAIPWYDEGITDPWDHVESAMGLTVAGCHEEAQRAFCWLRETQPPLSISRVFACAPLMIHPLPSPNGML